MKINTIGEENYPQRAGKNQELKITAELDKGIMASAKIDFLMLKMALFTKQKSWRQYPQGPKKRLI